ncbi:unnamed protein product [Musa banksii]
MFLHWSHQISSSRNRTTNKDSSHEGTRSNPRQPNPLSPSTIPIELTPSGRVATSRRLAKEAWGMQGLLRGCVNRGIRTAEDRVRGNPWRGGWLWRVEYPPRSDGGRKSWIVWSLFGCGKFSGRWVAKQGSAISLYASVKRGLAS